MREIRALRIRNRSIDNLNVQVEIFDPREKPEHPSVYRPSVIINETDGTWYSHDEFETEPFRPIGVAREFIRKDIFDVVVLVFDPTDADHRPALIMSIALYTTALARNRYQYRKAAPFN
jgi:hypothetical protein